MKLTDENIELYLFRYKEGLLGADEAAEVERAIANRPDWKEMADLYDPDLTLPAGATMPYADWQSLCDGGPKATPRVSLSTEKSRHNIRPLWLSLAAAACLMLFVVTIVRFTGSTTGTTGGIMTAQSENNADDILPATATDTITATLQNASTGNTVRIAHNSQPTLLAESEPVESAVEPQADSPKQMPIATPTDTTRTKYDLDEPTLREVNDPMDQEVLYANIITWSRDNAEAPTTISRRQQLRNIARHATSIIATTTATRGERRKAAEEAIEERLQSNELLNNIIASLE